MSLELPSVRLGARAIALSLPLLCSISFWGACTQPQKGDGESCLKNEDCASGVCSQLLCAAAPPLTDAQANNADATSEGSTGEAGDGATSEAAPETSTDAGGD